jgi:signal transduction histidine kinase
VPIRGGAGEVTHLATIERDVTEQKSLEARLRQSDKMQALGTLAGGIAHDFNNLLTAILGSLELVGPQDRRPAAGQAPRGQCHRCRAARLGPDQAAPELQPLQRRPCAAGGSERADPRA